MYPPVALSVAKLRLGKTFYPAMGSLVKSPIQSLVVTPVDVAMARYRLKK